MTRPYNRWPQCPVCGVTWLSTLETRRRASGAVIRRYECAGAPGTQQHRWTTVEIGGAPEFLCRRSNNRRGGAKGRK